MKVFTKSITYKYSVNEGERFKNNYCRYYEYEAIGTPYPLKCCAQGSETSRMCGSVSGEPACPSLSTDIACCNDPNPPSEDDCVYNGICYTDDDLGSTAEYDDLTCSEKHWCPVGFVWNDIQLECVPAIEMCHVGPEEDFCSITSYPYYDLLNPLCIQYGPLNTPPYPLPYEQACCFYITFGIMNYYQWEDIIVYSRVGGI